MVQLKYFGDDRDFFKYDLITNILKNLQLTNYVFVPMLTEHRVDNEGNKKPYNSGDKSQELYDFISKKNSKSLNHWEEWILNFVDFYHTLKPVDEIVFSDETRDKYFNQFKNLVKIPNSLVFIDPDTGLETGSQSYLRKMGREKYLLDKELKFLVSNIDKSSVLMIYQHLPYNKHIHIKSLNKKMEQVSLVDDSIYYCAYRENDLAFILISKNLDVYNSLCNILGDYCKRSTNNYKSFHNNGSF